MGNASSQVIAVGAAGTQVSCDRTAVAAAGRGSGKLVDKAAACLSSNSGTGTAQTGVMNEEVRRTVAVVTSRRNIVNENYWG